MKTRRVMFALLAGALMAPPALTCNTDSPRGTLEDQVLAAHRKASVVVLAKVVTANFQNALGSPFGEAPSHRARLEVIETWKGKQQAGSILRTVASTAAGTCAVVLTPGEIYLLYLGSKEPYDVSVAGRSARLDMAARDIEILRTRFGKTPAGKQTLNPGR